MGILRRALCALFGHRFEIDVARAAVKETVLGSVYLPVCARCGARGPEVTLPVEVSDG